MSSKNTRGSEWRKWDLHFHTPASYDYKDKSVTEKQIVDTLISKGVSVVAITDHHTMDIPRIRNLQNIAGDKLTVLPGIELRCELGGSDSIHFIGIFSEDCDLDDVWIRLQGEGKMTEACISKLGGNDHFYVDLKDTVKLIHDLNGLVSIHAGNKSNSIEKITNSLEHKMAQKKEIANFIDIYELGKVEDQEGYKEKVFPNIGKNIPMILCSDNHDIKNYHVKANLWVKADPTFEGLKQIVHEPEYRVHIGEYPPFDPPNYIQRITLNFPDNTTVGDGDKKDPFCLRGKTHELLFSPNYTCIIGGRGMGKSTILNLLVLKLDANKLDKSQIQKIQVVEKKDVKDFIDIDSKGFDFEYLSQNQIEDFAKDTDQLTKSLVNRLEQRDTNRKLYEIKNLIRSNITAFSELLRIDTSLRNLKKSIVEGKEQLNAYQKIQNAYENEEYRKLIQAGKATVDTLQKIQSSQKRFLNLRDALTQVSDRFQIIDEESNKYDTSFKEMVIGLNNLINRYPSEYFSDDENKVQNLSSEKIENQKQIRSYLEGRGVSEENLNQLSGISDEIGKLKQQIQEDEQRISQLEKNRSSLSNCESEAKDANEKYVQKFQTLIEEVNNCLGQIDSKQVKSIHLKYEFSFDKAKENLFQQFLDEFNIDKQSLYRLKDIFLDCIDLEKISQNTDGDSSFVDGLKNYSTTAQAKNFLVELFSSNENYDRLRILCQMNYYNPVDFGIIEVTYDGRLLKDTSFGQRCTAVLILLLLLGNNPIIIDEPEAHLDSLLISNYLVKLIKEQKKHRQIIFATHNANFVINGDAELIYVLEEGENGTTITPTTIENKEHKDKLIALEGGKEAFFRREQRY